MRDEDIRRMLAARAEQAPRPRPNRPRKILIRMAVLLALYVLSIGPMYWSWYGAKVGLGSPLFLVFYRPLEIAAALVPAVGHFLNWYISLWIY